MKSMHPARLTLLVTAGLLVVAAASPAHAQRDRDRAGERWGYLRPVAPTPLEEMRRGDDAFLDDVRRRQAGLLREGLLIVGARASVRVDEESGEWRARLMLEENEAKPEQEREVQLLPNSFLGELQQVVEATPNQRITFEVVGETLVHDGRNYLLLRAPARVAGLERIEVVESEAGPRRAEVPAEQPVTRSRRDAAEVMRDLERDAGPLHRTRVVPRVPVAPPVPGVEVHGSATTASVGARAATGADDQRQWREGALLTQRRGRVTRDATGAWRFVFEADVQGLSDPPVVLLPCLLLERLERYARSLGPTEPILISGEVFVHEGRGYLLPSAFQLPRERTPLN